MPGRERLVPLIVACPLFLQNLDTSVMATALPSMARSLDVQPLHLNLAITAYLLSLAVFLPLSGWCAERFGTRRVFCAAIGFFAFGSALCGIADSLGTLVLFRIVQGLGGALMVPVGRLILLRSVTPSRMVSAMVWFTVPPTIGRMIGPLVGGAIVSVTSWRWIFLLNIPFGLLGRVLALGFIDEQPPEPGAREPFDSAGFVLLALGLIGLLGALELAGKGMLGSLAVGGAGALGLACMLAYVWRSRRVASPLIDLGILRFATYRNAIVGGLPLRIAIGASPFLLPLMLQLGFGLSPLQSGALTVATALGSLSTRAVMARVIGRFGFRNLMLATALTTSVCYVSYGLFTPATPHPLMFGVMLLGGLVNSMGLVAMQTLGYSQIPPPRMSHATALSVMVQQVSVAFGVVLGATLVALAASLHGGDPAQPAAADFSPAFWAIGGMSLLSLFSFARLDRNAGAELR